LVVNGGGTAKEGGAEPWLAATAESVRTKSVVVAPDHQRVYEHIAKPGARRFPRAGRRRTRRHPTVRQWL